MMMIEIPQATLDFKNHHIKMKYEQKDLKKCSLPSAAVLSYPLEKWSVKNSHHLQANNLTSSGSHLL